MAARRIVGLAHLVEGELRDILVITEVARDEREVVFEGGCGIEQIKRPGPDAPAIAMELGTQPRTSPGNRLGEGDDRHPGEKLVELRLCGSTIGVDEGALVDLHVSDHADQEAIIGEPIEQALGCRFRTELIDHHVTVEQVRHP